MEEPRETAPPVDEVRRLRYNTPGGKGFYGPDQPTGGAKPQRDQTAPGPGQPAQPSK